ncbi:hypothetical protein H1D32_02595 [Anaerobacillus sp. CMMVII]|uniref:hypothetical protein n=1 Tax=Anaerobacillus sp. CMMVII TaxID=2755588 RepID=UPI0021B783D5|nr:hypothetical protein [Anaerobacillus sp. CMMVII]MCT8136737.1 hypothetical protein [Anaerobacillus sp. CMMVII]
MLKQAFWLAKRELKNNWIAFFFTMIATVLFAGFTTLLLDQLARSLFGTEAILYNDLLLDIMFVAITPSLAAIFMSGPYLSFRTVTEDPFNKRMALLRSLPIPLKTLALSRTLMMLLTLLVMSTVFYTTIVFALPTHFYELITRSELLIFILFWFGYTLALGGINPFIEYGTNGKILHLTPFILLVVIFITMVIYRSIFEYSIVEMSFLFVKDYRWNLVTISLIVGVVGCWTWNRLLAMRLQKKDFM